MNYKISLTVRLAIKKWSSKIVIVKKIKTQVLFPVISKRLKGIQQVILKQGTDLIKDIFAGGYCEGKNVYQSAICKMSPVFFVTIDIGSIQYVNTAFLSSESTLKMDSFAALIAMR